MLMCPHALLTTLSPWDTQQLRRLDIVYHSLQSLPYRPTSPWSPTQLQRLAD